MKVVTNTKLVEQRSKWAKRVAPLTMLFLIGGLITNFLSINQPEMFRPTLILLTLGFLSAMVSSNLVNSWVREPRADQVLEQLLKKFGNDYMLFNYTSPVRHVLLAPNALYVITVKNVDGQITVNDRRISRKFTLRRLFRLLGDESLASPMAEAEKQVRRLHKFLSPDLPDEAIPDLEPIILFANKNAELTVNEPAIPVLVTKQLKSFLREAGKARNVSAEQRKRLAELLGPE